MRLKRIITLLLVLLLALTLLSSCAETGDGLQVETTGKNTKQDPLQLLEALEYKLEKPSEELQNKFVEEYIAYKNYDPNNHPTVAIEYWLGSYGDVGFMLMYDSGTPLPGSPFRELVADSKFEYPYGQSIVVWANKQFLSLEEAWEKVLITTKMIAKIAEVYEQKQYIEVYKYSTLDPTITEYRLEMPTRAVREKFEREYSEYMNTTYPGGDASATILRWYGSYGDIGFLRAMENSYYPTWRWGEIVAGIEFEYWDGDRLYVWVDKKILSVTEAYEQNLITKDMVEKIAENWAQKKYIEIY